MPHCGAAGAQGWQPRRLVAVLLALLVALLPPATPARPQVVAAALPGELLVRLQPAADPLAPAPLGPRTPIRAEPALPALGLQLVRVPPGAEAGYAAALRALPGVRGVEPNTRVEAAGIPNDPYFGDYQWNLRQIRAPEAWDLTTGDRRVTIAILDTGISLDHPDLVEKLVPGTNLVTPSSPPADDNGHGTHVAGIAAAATNNGQGVAGTDWEARLMPVKVLDQAGGGDVNRVAQGIVWAVDQGARVLNLSFTGGEASPALADAVQYARGRGALVVAAVGNEGQALVTYPAATEGVLAVGATDRNDRRLPASNTGSYVALSAPGQEIPSTFWDPTVGNTYALASTTSQAAPQVAGVASLVWSVNPELGGDAVRTLLENHADDAGPPGRDDETGAGRVNAYRSVLAALPWNYDSGGAASYRAFADAAPRLFLPYVVKASNGWTSSITIRNPTPQQVTLTLTFITQTGAAVTSVGAGLNPFGATTLPLQLLSEVPAGFQGSAVIDAASRLTAVVEQDRAGADRHGYTAVVAGTPRLYAPLVRRGGRAGSTILYLQSIADARETATVTYYTTLGLTAGQETVPLVPRAGTAVRLADNASLPEDFVGAAVIESAGGGPLGAVAVQIGADGESTAYTLPSETGMTLAVPLVFKNARGWSTGIQVFNTGTIAAQVTATYSRAPSAPASTQAVPAPVQESITIPPRGGATLYQPANASLPDEYVGSALLAASTGGPLVAVVNQARAGRREVTAYTAAATGASSLDLPLLAKDYGGWTAGLRLQNLAADTAEVTLTYYDQTGRAAYTAQDTLPAGGGATYALGSLTALPWGFLGSATITSNGRPLTAVANLLKPAP